MIRATEIFRLLEGVTECTHVRHQFACPEFSRVRRSMRTIITALLDDESSSEVVERLRHLLFFWLTTPLPFSALDTTPLEKMGRPSVVGGLWGRDVMHAFECTMDELLTLRSMTSPLRSAVEESLLERVTGGTRIRVFCNRNARATFTSLYGWSDQEAGGAVEFLHTPRDYRVADLFDTLIKVGPLRTSGYSSITGAVVNAPRYHSLYQFTWSGLSDDERFGRDPLLSALDQSPRADAHPPRKGHAGAPVRWQRTEVQSGHEDAAYTALAAPADELALFAKPSSRMELPRGAALVQIGTEFGVLYPPGAEIIALTMEPDGGTRIEQTTVARLESRSFLAWPELGDIDLGGAHATDGTFSEAWKRRLAGLLDSRPTWLEEELRRNGLQLRGLKGCLEHWSKRASSVIHAPQQRVHFEILIRVLGIENDAVAYPRPPRMQWWRLAWAEIARSRGHAVQVGMQEQDVIHSELLHILNSVGDILAPCAEKGETFPIPFSRNGLNGLVTFYRVDAVETGYRVPESVLKTIVPLDKAYEWRV